MAGNKKPRKKYRPKHVFQNPVAFVLEGFERIADRTDSYLTDLKIKNSMAMAALLRGTAKKEDMDTIVAMSNMTEALQQIGFGTEYEDVSTKGRFAIYQIVLRSQKHGKFTPTGPEITSLNMLMELHDAQMEIITLNDLDRALTRARKMLRSKETVRLPDVPDQLK